ncbi:DUF3734 domain-containing protein, partial [Achromobacter sp.]|uniref:DUF3734 domain-containing protein n=1 Tax=Achromobacter sp. TaxID=134375 RepID=UPI0031DCD89E
IRPKPQSAAPGLLTMKPQPPPGEFAFRKLSHTPATNIINLIYEAKHRERYSKDYEFGTEAMREHWESGLTDIRRTLEKPGILARPTQDSCFVTHDIHRNGTHHS